MTAICEYVIETGDTNFVYRKVFYENGYEITIYEYLTTILDHSEKYFNNLTECFGLNLNRDYCLEFYCLKCSIILLVNYIALQYFIEIVIHLK